MKRSEKWENNLKNLRTRELKIIFKYFGNMRFSKCLELGAGDGFQSKILINICDELIATDLNSKRLYASKKDRRLEYKVIDAELVDKYFDKASFDLIHSSNLMEHLPNIDECLIGCFNVLKNDGFMVSVIPNPKWRLLASVLYYPVKIYRLFKFFLSKVGLSNSVRLPMIKNYQGNNIKLKRQNRSFLNQLIPPPHGVSKNSFFEFFEFRKSKWKKNFEKNGFQIVDILNGPISSGYGLGFDWLKSKLELLGFTTEYIYILKKTEKL